MRRSGFTFALALFGILALFGTSCSSSEIDSSGGNESESETASTQTASTQTIAVPADWPTIQEAVDAAKPGDLVLVSEGTYNEDVDVVTNNITIRGLDRNKVILDGDFKLENGIRILEANGVVVENMTARNFTSNGFYWTGVEGYRGSYLTAYRNGDYGIYAFDSVNGQLDNSYGSGSPDAGFYIGQCFPCNALVDNVVSEFNGLGYSGTNAGGDLFIVNSTFRNNRAGVVPNSGSYELCYPERETTMVGNIVHDNNSTEAPAIEVALLAQGNGILLPGGIRNVVQRNLVFNHDRTGIGLVPFPEEDASALAPAESEWDTPCSETRDVEVPPIPAADCKAVDGLLKGCVVFWNPYENRILDNNISASKVADLAVGTIDLLGLGVTTDMLRNCFSGNTFSISAPSDLEALAPCDAAGNGGSWDAGALDLLGLLGSPAAAPPKDTYKTTPEPAAQPTMANAGTAKVTPAPTGPPKVDIAAIALPARPAGT